MIETFYLHLEFENKKGDWSVNLPFLCTKCGACCLLEDFLCAGEINVKAEELPEVRAKIKALFEELGKMWEADPAKCDDYCAHTPCPFLFNNGCTIYEIRPIGCRLFPKTTFGMQSQDCQPLGRFKKQHNALTKGRAHKETYHFTVSHNIDQTIINAKFTEEQYQGCIAKLRQTGITEDELILFNYFNAKTKK